MTFDVLVGFALTFAALPSAQEPPLAWLVGEWCTQRELGKTICETWQPLRDGVMRGESRTMHERYITLDERMRITVEPKRLVFHAEPHGQAPADFYAVGKQAPRSVTFVNRAHDYPQRVRYWREGELLKAEISLVGGGKPMRWTYHREKD